MYDDLVKRLRGFAVELRKADDELLVRDAADAIEELQNVANKLLAKYQEEATSVVWEYSGNIEEDIDCLNEEVRTLMAQINGMPLPKHPNCGAKMGGDVGD